MNFNKLKAQLESFLNPKLAEAVRYKPTSYRYVPDKTNACHLTLNDLEIFNSKLDIPGIRWYKTDQEIFSDPEFRVTLAPEEVAAVRKTLNDAVPAERVYAIAKDRKEKQVAKAIFKSQSDLFKSNFQELAQFYMTHPVEDSLNSDSILLNVFALTDRRVGKKRMSEYESLLGVKHPVVRYVFKVIQAL